MSELPENWGSCEIGDVAKVVGGGTPSSGDPTNFTKKGGIPWITPADLSKYKDIYIRRGARNLTEKGLRESSAKIIPAGSVLFSSRAPVGYVVIASNDVTTNQGFKSFILPEDLDNRFVYYYLRHIKPIAEGMATGTTFKELSGANAARLPFTIAPLPEQKRIADKLDSLLARVDACQEHLARVPAILKRFRQSVLAAAFRGELVEQDPKNEPASELIYRLQYERRKKWEESKAINKKEYVEIDFPNLRELPELPDGWAWATPEQLASTDHYALAIGPFGSSLMVKDYTEEGVPLIFVRNIRSGVFLGSNTSYISLEKADELRAHKVVSGDILITKMGDPPGDAFLYPDGMPNAIATSDCLKWSLSPLLFDKRFFVHAIHSPFVKYQIAQITKGVAQQKMSLARFKTIAIPVPPLAEQHEIVRRVEKLFAFADRLEARWKTAQALTAQLTPSLLAKAFRGELVPQDPDDEPASALLARIRKASDKNPTLFD